MGYGRHGYYPHMLPPEVEVWDRYLDEHKDEYVKFEYDVHVGKPPPREVIEKYPLQVQAAILASYLFRIDAVGYLRAGGIEIIEVKEFASTTAIGQVLLYNYLYKRDFKPRQIIKMRIVTNRTTQDIVEFCKVNNIAITVLERIV